MWRTQPRGTQSFTDCLVCFFNQCFDSWLGVMKAGGRCLHRGGLLLVSLSKVALVNIMYKRFPSSCLSPDQATATLTLG